MWYIVLIILLYSETVKLRKSIGRSVPIREMIVNTWFTVSA